jgi:glutamine amidotransferase
VGMQILFADSEELYEGEKPRGVGIFPGSIRKLVAPVLPHIGWNQVKVNPGSRAFESIERERFYFVHSYAALDEVNGALNVSTNYGSDFIAALETDSVTAVQFHPEKSGRAGLTLISNWAASL